MPPTPRTTTRRRRIGTPLRLAAAVALLWLSAMIATSVDTEAGVVDSTTDSATSAAFRR